MVSFPVRPAGPDRFFSRFIGGASRSSGEFKRSHRPGLH
jgi:hypothetical protein